MQNTIEIDGKIIPLRPGPRWTPDEDTEILEQFLNVAERASKTQPEPLPVSDILAKPWLTIADIARLEGAKPKAIRARLERLSIPSRKVGGRLVVMTDDYQNRYLTTPTNKPRQRPKKSLMDIARQIERQQERKQSRT